MNRTGIYAVCSCPIKVLITLLAGIAKAFDAIFTSTFRSDIGLQFLTNRKSLSFLAITVIKARFCDVDNSLFSKE